MAERKLSAVIACYLDAQAIPLMHRRLTDVFAALGVDYEIIFVNDGSPDETDSVLRDVTREDEHVLAIEHSRNFGSQNAFVSGMQLATGDAVVLLDGDLQDPPELIAAFYSKWREGYDVVYGRRSERAGSAPRALFAKLFYRVFRGLADVPMPLDAGDFALMDRRVVDVLLALPEADQFLRGLRAWVGFKQTGVDHVRPERTFGRSTHGFAKNVWWAKKAVVSFSSVPIELFGYVGAVLTSCAFFAVLVELIVLFRRPEPAHAVALAITLVVFFGGLNLLAVAVVGEYVIKVSEETKRRPKFIRKAVRRGREHLVNPRQLEEFVRARSLAATNVAVDDAT